MAARAQTPTLYFKRNCSGCDVARRWLKARGIQVKEREIFREPLTGGEITRLLGNRRIEVVLSTRTKQYAARGLNQRPHTAAELLGHMEAEPRLLRRPMLELGPMLLVGFDAKRWGEALSSGRADPNGTDGA
jgi:Spx/MgsR family transcriptional regulator